MKKQHFLLLLATTALYSCTKELKPSSLSPEKKSLAVNAPNSIGTFGKFSVLGWGYDITKEYGTMAAVTNQVIDIDRYDNANSSRVIIDSTNTQYGISSSGADAAGMLQDLDSKTTVTITPTIASAIFKGTITANYSDIYTFSSRFVYGYFSQVVQRRRTYINAPESDLYSYVTPTFAADVQSQSPAYIVQHYGTHVMFDCILGGKLEIVYRAETRNSNRKDAASIGVNIGVLKTVNLNSNLTYNSASETKNFNQSLSYITHGGDASRSIVKTISYNNAADTSATLTISDWQNSITPGNSELIDLGKYSAYPIWDFIADPTKAAAVKDYITQYIQNNGVQLLDDNFASTPLYRAVNTSSGDHLLTTNQGEVAGVKNWSLEGSTGYIYTSSHPGLIPLYRYFVGGYHFFTTNANEVSSAYSEGIVGYLDQTQGLGEIPYYRYAAKGNAHGHMYTSNFAELGNGNSSWTLEGIIGYISK
jgi:hypothetical protein